MTESIYINDNAFLTKQRGKFEESIYTEYLLNKEDKKTLPITFKKDGKLETIDYIENTSGIIVGGSGTGKTYFLNNVIKQWAMTTSPKELKLILFCKKSKFEYKNIDKLPHVLTVSDDLDKFREMLVGVYDEIQCRFKFLKQQEDGVFNLKIYNKLNKDNKVPNLMLMIDDMTTIMAHIQDKFGDEYYKDVKNLLSKISQEGRSAGVRLLVTAHRAIDTSIPKNVVANSSFKLAFRLEAKSDYAMLNFNNIIDKIEESQGDLIMDDYKGSSILKVMDKSNPINISTLEDETNNDITEIIKYWEDKKEPKNKYESKNKYDNIFSNKLLEFLD